MIANTAFHIAVLPGDGIGPEVMTPTLEILRRIEATTPSLKFRFTESAAGAGHYKDTGKSMPESTVKLCEEADAIQLGACGLPSVRYPDNTEIMPQVELRFMFDLYAGVRPCQLIPMFRPDRRHKRGIDFVLIPDRPSLFASMGKLSSRMTTRANAGDYTQDIGRLFDFFLHPNNGEKARKTWSSDLSTRPMPSRPMPISARSSTACEGISRGRSRYVVPVR
jgi:3-isopropylmalate dehydrogenase